MTKSSMIKLANKLAAVCAASPKYTSFAELSKSVQYGMIFGQRFSALDGQTLEKAYPDDYLHIAGKMRYNLIKATDPIL